MLHFFRKYQKFFFLFVAIITIITFVFFGAIQTLIPRYTSQNETAFLTAEGKKVSHQSLEEMIYLLSTPNPFDDGVIERDFISTGLAFEIFKRYRPLFQQEFEAMAARERAFKPFVSTLNPSLSAQRIWDLSAPALPLHLCALQKCEDFCSDEALSHRVALYMSQRAFPGEALKESLFYKCQEEKGAFDSQIFYTDFSLFGYKGVKDWFGPSFLRVAAEMIFQCASIAKNEGYSVSRQEALADLQLHIEERAAYQNKGYPLKQLLQQFQLDESTLVRLWQKVLLFRRLLEDKSSCARMAHPLEEYFAQAQEGATIELYQLPAPFQFLTEGQWQQFEVYLDALSPDRSDLTALPAELLPLEEVKKRAPLLIKKRFTVDVASLHVDALQSRVGVQESWDWEVQEANWARIVARFPELKGPRDTATRLAALEALSPEKRAPIDRMARESLVALHPEWRDEVLSKKSSQKRCLEFVMGKLQTPLEGVGEGENLFKLLANAKEPFTFTEDKQHFYSISACPSPEESLLSYKEASKLGVLEKLLDQKLRAHYQKIREKSASTFKDAKGAWVSFESVRDKIAKDYFLPLLQQLKAKDVEVSEQNIAKRRLFLFVEKERMQCVNRSAERSRQEWALETKMLSISRAHPYALSPRIGLEMMKDLKIEEFSVTQASPAPYFFRLLSLTSKDKDVIAQKNQIEELLVNEAKCVYMVHLMESLEERQLIKNLLEGKQLVIEEAR